MTMMIAVVFIRVEKSIIYIQHYIHNSIYLLCVCVYACCTGCWHFILLSIIVCACVCLNFTFRKKKFRFVSILIRFFFLIRFDQKNFGFSWFFFYRPLQYHYRMPTIKETKNPKSLMMNIKSGKTNYESCILFSTSLDPWRTKKLVWFNDSSGGGGGGGSSLKIKRKKFLLSISGDNFTVFFSLFITNQFFFRFVRFMIQYELMKQYKDDVSLCIVTFITEFFFLLFFFSSWTTLSRFSFG